MSKRRTSERSTFTDENGTVRYADSNRKVRKDKGTRKPHPPHCAHCEMVREYHRVRDAALRIREVPAGDEDSFIPTFRWWLTQYRYEQEPYYVIAA